MVDSGRDFEKQFEAMFPIIRKKTGAFLHRLYPPVRGAGMRGTMPVFVIVGRATYDVGGWQPLPVLFREGTKLAQAIGIELKANKQRHSSMPIIGKDGHGSGLQAHQLESLAALHRDGGVARVLWNNGGVIGVLEGPMIAKTFYDYGVSVEVEKLGKKPAFGSRSVRWDAFRSLPDFLDSPWGVIMEEVKPPTIKQSLAANRRKNAKLIEEAHREAAEARDAEEVILRAAEEDEEEGVE